MGTGGKVPHFRSEPETQNASLTTAGALAAPEHLEGLLGGKKPKEHPWGFFLVNLEGGPRSHISSKYSCAAEAILLRSHGLKNHYLRNL